MIVASLSVALTALLKEVILSTIYGILQQHIEFAALLSIIILFAPVSIILGIVSPYATRLKLVGLNKSGKVIGNLYAISTFGSIIGTFLAGFYLIPIFGNKSILYQVATVLMVISTMLINRKHYAGLVLGTTLLVFIYFAGEHFNLFKLKALVDLDTQYSRIIVRDITDKNGRTLRTLSTDNRGLQSAIYPDNPNDLVAQYARALRLSNKYDGKVNSALMIGGAAYTYPRDFLRNNPNSSIDVVEIDPAMTDIAKKYFFLRDDPRMTIIHQDARLFVKRVNKKYDFVFLDAFLGLTPPPHLTTEEFMTDIRSVLANDGVLMINLYSAIEGNKSKLYTAEVNTLRKVFPHLDAYLPQKRNLSDRQSITLVAYKNIQRNELKTSDPQLSYLVSTKITFDRPLGNGQILTDDHSPVEYFAN